VRWDRAYRPTLWKRLRSAWATFRDDRPDFEAARSEILAGNLRYRVAKVRGGYEPQMLYTTGTLNVALWFPLTKDGAWLEPEAFSYGTITKRNPMSEQAAIRSVASARLINGARTVHSL